MSGGVLRVQRGVAVVTLDNPPVNGMGLAVRMAVARAFSEAQSDAGVRAIVLVGANGLFSGGADIREFGTPKALEEPTLRTLIAAAESSVKPVIAAVEGTCMGGGLELALGCHYRVASPDARFALPEVKLGLIPGAGGTQRLPRAVGVEKALGMIVSGEPVPAAKLAGTRLVDRIVEGSLLEGAIAFALEVAERRPLPRLRDVAVESPPASLLDAARAKAAKEARGQPAPQRCVDAVAAAASKPFDEGIAFERALFIELMATPESRALRHAFFAERAAARIPDVPADTKARRVEHVAVVGAGTMGGGIAMTFLNAGLPVTLVDSTQAALDRGVANIRRNYEASVQRGKLDAPEMDRRLARLRPSLALQDVANADLVVEAVFEEMGVKEDVFRRLDATAREGAILATNTSTLDVNRIAAATRRPGDVVGMHYFSPANVMRLLEVVRADATAKDVLATVMQVAKRTGKTAVVSGVCDGFIGNRMLAQYYNQAWFLLEEGATPAQVDRALEAFGMAMGPFRVSDLAGNDIGWAVRKRRYAERPDMVISRVADRICEAGRFGQKTSAGWYRYEPGSREALPDPAVDALIEEHRRSRGIRARPIDAAEIVDRCIYALVNEGARIVEEGIAARASDVDVVYLAGYGFPRSRGGPLQHADLVGLARVEARMGEFASNPVGDPAFWTPAPLLVRLAREGRGFNG
jgi:3-hydroxyacyl-CoA dehydrogenase